LLCKNKYFDSKNKPAAGRGRRIRELLDAPADCKETAFLPADKPWTALFQRRQTVLLMRRLLLTLVQTVAYYLTEAISREATIKAANITSNLLQPLPLHIIEGALGMPRTKIEIPGEIEYLSILDEEGNLDSDLEPDLSEETLLRLHEFLLLGRRFDERLLSLQRQGRVGTFPPASGQEAAHLGAAATLRPSDWMIPAFRETAAELWRGRSMESVILYNNGFNEGVDISEDRNDFPICVPVGSQILHAVGIAWSIAYRQKNDVALTFFGDGATSQGDFHEGLNFAGVYRIPVIFVCQNNQWAISIPRKDQTRSETLAQKAIAYGIRGIQVDGNDILAVNAAAAEAAERARSGQGATLIECVTYRMSVHTTADDPKRYRSDDEVENWRRRDPIPRFQKYLVAKGLLSPDQIEAVESGIQDQIQTAVKRAEEQMKALGDPLDMFKHTYAELPPHLVEQKAYLTGELSGQKKE
jgi:pyruvate dehydrogenase E1 component alpha subunit